MNMTDTPKATDGKETFSKEKVREIIKECQESIKEVEELNQELRTSNNFLLEYLDRLMCGEDEELTYENFIKEKLDEVCVQISSFRDENADTPENKELKMLEQKKAYLEDQIQKIQSDNL